MKKIMILLLALAVLILSVSCGGESKSPTWRVTKGTGLYAAFDIDADMIAELPEGTLLAPQEEGKDIFCGTITESGTDYTLCKVKVVNTGELGWVLQKWMEQQ